MGVNDLAEDEQIPFDDSVTIGQLKKMYGEEVVRRGVEYMLSLQDADQEFRQSIQSEDLDEGWEEGYGVDDIETDASDKWAEKSKEKGLGLDE